MASTLVGVKKIDGSVEAARKQFVNGISTAETQYEKNVKSSRIFQPNKKLVLLGVCRPAAAATNRDATINF